MYNFVRASKYRHVFGTAYKRDECYEDMRLTISAWDTNYISVNSKYIAVNWNAGGGGAFGVVPLSTTGRLPKAHPLFTGHTAQVLDTDFSPFNDNLIASVAEDARLRIWSIDEDKLLHYPLSSASSTSEENIISSAQNFETPLLTLKGHNKKIGHTLFNPSAENVIATSSADQTVRLWDIEYGQQKGCVEGFSDNILSFDWSYNGSLIAATSRDKNIRLLDPRSDQVVSSAQSHLGIKGSRVVWLGNSGKLLTTGFNRTSGREIYLWDPKNFSKPILQMDIDTSSGILMPFYDSGSDMLYLAGKGDGNIRYYEHKNGKLYYISEYKSAEPQRGMGAMPKTGLNFQKFELMRMYKITVSNIIEPISFQAPRKGDAFLPDLYPPAPGPYPALSSSEYFEGKTADPVLVDLESIFEGKTPRIVSPDEVKNVETPLASPVIPEKIETSNQAQRSFAPRETKSQNAPGDSSSNPFLSSKTQKLLNTVSIDNDNNDNDEHGDNDKSDEGQLDSKTAEKLSKEIAPESTLELKIASELTQKFCKMEIEQPRSSPAAAPQADTKVLEQYKELFDLRLEEIQMKFQELKKASSARAAVAADIAGEKDKQIQELKLMVDKQAQEHIEVKSMLKEELGTLRETLTSTLAELDGAKQTLDKQAQEHIEVRSMLKEEFGTLQAALKSTKAELDNTNLSLDKQSARVSDLEAQLTKTIDAAISLVTAAEKLQ